MASKRETVALLASPPGEGGVAVVEVVGPEAVTCVARRFSKPLPSPGRLAVGRLVDEVVVRGNDENICGQGCTPSRTNCGFILQNFDSRKRE